jgi:hypothetical protein
MALSYDGGGLEFATVLDVSSRTPMIPVGTATNPAGAVRWNFSTFTPDADLLVTGYVGTLTLRRLDGSAINTVPVGTSLLAAQPEFSPDGRQMVYIERGTAADAPAEADWQFVGGRIKIIPFDPATNTWGTPRTLHAPTGATNAYYPTWSPDGEWILFNQSSENAYDDGSAQLYVMKADGSAAPIRLDSPDVRSGFTNSWARWAPFSQLVASGTADEEPMFWLTFSSKRDFGVRLRQADLASAMPPYRPQIWMAPFFPRRAENGRNPSAAAFRLPFQDLGTSNHIAQWTERVVVVE